MLRRAQGCLTGSARRVRTGQSRGNQDAIGYPTPVSAPAYVRFPMEACGTRSPVSRRTTRNWPRCCPERLAVHVRYDAEAVRGASTVCPLGLRPLRTTRNTVFARVDRSAELPQSGQWRTLMRISSAGHRSEHTANRSQADRVGPPAMLRTLDPGPNEPCRQANVAVRVGDFVRRSAPVVMAADGLPSDLRTGRRYRCRAGARVRHRSAPRSRPPPTTSISRDGF